VGLYTELFYAIIPTLFADLLSLHLVTFLMFFILVDNWIDRGSLSPCTRHISNSANVTNGYALLLSALYMCKSDENGITNEAIVLK